MSSSVQLRLLLKKIQDDIVDSMNLEFEGFYHVLDKSSKSHTISIFNLRNLLSELQDQLTNKTIIFQLDELQSSLTKLFKDIISIDEYNSVKSELDSNVDNLSSKQNQYQTQINNLKEENKNLKQKLSDIELRHEKSQLLFSSSQKEKIKLTEDIRQLEEKVDQISKEHERLKERHRVINLNLESSKKRLVDYSLIKEEAAKYKIRVAELEDINKELHFGRKKLQIQLDNLDLEVKSESTPSKVDELKIESEIEMTHPKTDTSNVIDWIRQKKVESKSEDENEKENEIEENSVMDKSEEENG